MFRGFTRAGMHVRLSRLIYNVKVYYIKILNLNSQLNFQATLANIRELKLGVENIAEPNNISDFTEALTRAFKTLEKVHNIHNELIILFHTIMVYVSNYMKSNCNLQFSIVNETWGLCVTKQSC